MLCLLQVRKVQGEKEKYLHSDKGKARAAHQSVRKIRKNSIVADFPCGALGLFLTVALFVAFILACGYWIVVSGW